MEHDDIAFEVEVRSDEAFQCSSYRSTLDPSWVILEVSKECSPVVLWFGSFRVTGFGVDATAGLLEDWCQHVICVASCKQPICKFCRDRSEVLSPAVLLPVSE